MQLVGLSKLGGLKSSLSMAWFKSGGSRHSLRVLFAFSTTTKLLTQSTGSSTLVIISLLSKSSRVALSLFLNLRGTFLCGWMVGWLLTFSLMVYSPSTHPKPSKTSWTSFKIARFCWTSLILRPICSTSLTRRRVEDFNCSLDYSFFRQSLPSQVRGRFHGVGSLLATTIVISN